MNELSLFSGAGGGLLATQHMLNWRSVGYVENDTYCQGILARRTEDGLLHSAPIFGDIRRFNEDGWADAYQGMVDVISAGFPCQPFSVAGKQAGEDDERNMWPATIECIRLVRPRFAFLENVPGLLASGYFGQVLGDLAKTGYDAEWCVLGADDVGAPHRRKRLWILAYANEAGRGEQRRPEPVGPEQRPAERGRSSWWNIDPADIPDAESGGQSMRGRTQREARHATCTRENMGKPEGERKRPGLRTEEPPEQRERRSGDAGSRATESGVGRMADGVADRLDFTRTIADGPLPRVATGVQNRASRLKAVGNGQVPATNAAAFEVLDKARCEKQDRHEKQEERNT